MSQVTEQSVRFQTALASIKLIQASAVLFFFFKQKTAYEMVTSDWSSDVCSSDLLEVIESGQSTRTYRVAGRLGEATFPYYALDVQSYKRK